MSWEALIRFAPATTLERLNDPAWLDSDRLMYDATGLKLLPLRQYACNLHPTRSVTRRSRPTKNRRSSSSVKISRPSTPREVRWYTP